MNSEAIRFIRTDSQNADFVQLVAQLDAYLTITDREEHAFYDRFNKLDKINCVVVAYLGEQAVACGAIKPFAPKTMEIKRMYTTPESRGHGLATKILQELERWAGELSCSSCILETGKRQPEAIRVYEKNGYYLIPNYGQYAERDNSLCFEKKIA